MSLRAFIQHNFLLKVFSLLLATLIWFAIDFWKDSGRELPTPITNPQTKQNLRLQVRVLKQPGDTRIFKVNPEDVVVEVAGEAALLRDVNQYNIPAYVDLTSARSSRETNHQVKLDMPNGVTLINVSPRAVNVEQLPP